MVAPLDAGVRGPNAAPDLDALAAAARAALAPYVVADGDPPPSTVYTWTTLAQVQELAGRRTLLTREVSVVHGAAYYDQFLRLRTGSDPVAAVLATKAFAKARFAWTAPWATLLGWPGESYGDQLVSVTLKPEAWVVILTTSGGPMRGVDLQGRGVPNTDLLAHPERVGAVYFVHDDAGAGGRGTTAGALARAGYREIVLCNESMIARYGVGTTAELGAVAASVKAVQATLAYVEALPPAIWDTDSVDAWNRRAAREWRTPRPEVNADPLDVYDAALAMPNESYAPEPKRLRALLERLNQLPRPERALAFTHEPTVKFVAADAKVPKPPLPTKVSKPGRPTRGTF